MKLFKVLKRPVAFAVAAIMAVSLIPASPLAAKTKYKTKTEGGKEYIVFGSYEQDDNTNNGKEPIEWEVLDENKNGILVISRYILDGQPYNKKNEEVTWQSCTLRKWLNKEFFSTAFNAKEKKKIKTIKIKNDDNPLLQGKGGKDTKDKIFCLSLDEVFKYYKFSTFYDESYCGYSKDIIIPATKYAEGRGITTFVISELEYEIYYKTLGSEEDCINLGGAYWWMRSPGHNGSYACVASYYGVAGANEGASVDCDGFGVRPVMYLKK